MVHDIQQWELFPAKMLRAGNNPKTMTQESNKAMLPSVAREQSVTEGGMMLS